MLYNLKSLVRVIQHIHSTADSSKLDLKYFGLCEVLEVRDPIFTLCERCIVVSALLSRVLFVVSA